MLVGTGEDDLIEVLQGGWQLALVNPVAAAGGAGLNHGDESFPREALAQGAGEFLEGAGVGGFVADDGGLPDHLLVLAVLDALEMLQGCGGLLRGDAKLNGGQDGHGGIHDVHFPAEGNGKCTSEQLKRRSGRVEVYLGNDFRRGGFKADGDDLASGLLG